MSNEILSITKKVPKNSTIPDGHYKGVWGGYIIEVVYNKCTYELTVAEGVRGVGIQVVVTMKDGIATFEKLKN